MKYKKIYLIFAGMFLLVFGAVYSDGGCCIVTNDGTPCVNSPDGQPLSNCGTFLPEECSSHDECTSRGACILFEENICDEGVSEDRCLSIGGEPHVNRECSELGGFQDVCCRVSVGGFSSYSFMPENECSNLEGETFFDYDEVQCQQQNEPANDRKGCCVNADQSCSYGFESSCDEGSFQPFYCSVLQEQCNPVCESHSSIGPGPSELEMQYDLYNLDSCGNPEEIYRECDNFREMPVLNDGRWECGSAVCNSVWDNPYTDENHDNVLDNDNSFSLGGSSRNFRFNGESWCEYQQAKVGPALDLPGTQHYMHRCDFGEEKVIPSESEGRNKICVEEIVDAGSGYKMSQAKWLDNTQPDRCLVCNTVENTEDCCRARVQQGNACSYVPRYDLTENPRDLDLFLDREVYADLQDLLDGQINNFVGLHDLYVDSVSFVYYDAEGNVIERSGNILDGEVIGESNLAVNACDEENIFCLVRLLDLPEVSGTYNLRAEYSAHMCWLGTGRWCGSDRCCGRDNERGSIEAGEYSFNFDSSGICVPIVPPSRTDLCGQLSELGNVVDEEGRTESYIGFNNYFNFPFVRFGQFGECDSTEECREHVFENFNYRASESFVIDDINRFCRSLGDCGIAPNIAGRYTTGGFAMSHMCLAPIASEDAWEACTSPEEIYPAISLGDFQAVSGGTPLRPENYLALILIFPLSLRRRFMKNKYLFLLLFLIFLAGCSGGQGIYQQPPSVVQCNAWQPPSTTDECWRCSATWDEDRDGMRGLLPANNLKTIDDKSAYKCTRYLCESLGNCQFVEGISEEGGGAPECVPIEPEIARIPKIVLDAPVSFTCNLFDPAGCNDNSASIQNERHVLISGKLEPLAPIEIRFRTVDTNDPSIEVPTTCEFADNSGMNSASVLPFPDSGSVSIDHIFKIVNHGSRDSNYKYYMRCTSRDGENTVQPHATVEFNVGRAGYVSPIIRSISPASGEAYVKHDESTKRARLTVAGDVVQCRWSRTNVGFDEMAETTAGDDVRNIELNTAFGCTTAGLTGERLCEAVLADIAEGENRFWFSCAGRVQECDELLGGVSQEQVEGYLECSGTQEQCNRRINNRISEVNNYLNCLREGGRSSNPWPEEGYLVTGTSALNISSIKCLHILGEECGTIFDNSFDVVVETAGGAQNGNAACRWALAEYDFDAFDEPGGTRLGPSFAATHIEREISRNTGEYNLRFRCEDVAGNVAEDEVTVNLERDNIPPKIIKVYRYGDELNIKTNEFTTCSYVNEASTNFADAEQLTSSDGIEHKAMITNNFYRVRCTDRFDNFRQTDVYT